MYTATLKDKQVDNKARRITVVVTVTDGNVTFDQAFSFSLDTSVETMKKTVKNYLDELNGAGDKVSGLTDLDYVEPTPDTPTADELVQREWFADWAKLQTVDQLIAAGVLTGNEAAVTALRGKVKANFKPSYL